jgi:hypothetical protein
MAMWSGAASGGDLPRPRRHAPQRLVRLRSRFAVCSIANTHEEKPDENKRRCARPLQCVDAEATRERTLSLTNLYTKRQRIAELARTKRGVAFHLRNFLDRRVRDGVNDNIRERSSSMKNRKREYCTSVSVRDEGGNILKMALFILGFSQLWPGDPRPVAASANVLITL